MLRRSYFATPRLPSTCHSSSFSPFQTTSHRLCSVAWSASSILSFKHQPESKSFLVNINNRKILNNNQNNDLSSYSISVPYVFLADHSLTLVEPSTFQRSIPINYERDQLDANKNKFFDENCSSSSFIDEKLKLAFFKRNETEWLAVPVESFFQLVAAREGQMKGSPKVAGDLFDALMEAFEANSSAETRTNIQTKTEGAKNDTKNDILDELINSSSSSEQKETTQKKNARSDKKEIPEEIKKLIESHHNLEAIRSALGLTSGHVRLAVSNWLQHREKTQSIHETLEEVGSIQNEQEKTQSERALKLSMNSFEFGNPAMMAKSDTIKLWKRKDILEALSTPDDSSTTLYSPSPKVSGIFPKEMHEFVHQNKSISSSSSLYESQVQSLLSSPSAKLHRKNIISRVAHSIEKFGFCVIEDPVLALGLPQPLSLNTAEEPTGMPSSGMIADLLNNKDDPERALQVVHRRNSVDFILKFLFGVLMNSHYGVTPVWGNFVDPNATLTKHDNNHRQNCSSSSSTTNKNQTDNEQQQQQNEIDHLDTAYLTCGIDLHTDQTYSIQSPKLQGFGLIHNDPSTSKGGKNVLADGFAIAKHMQEHYPKEFATLLSNCCPAYYCKDGRLLGGYRSVFEFSHNSFGFSGGGKSISQISFNAYDRAPAVVFDLAATTNKKSKNSNESSTMMMRKMNEFYEAYSLFGDLCHDRIVSNKKNQDDHFSFELQPQIGQLLIFDNHRCLHARTGFTGPRIMCGSYVGVDDYFSALNHYQL